MITGNRLKLSDKNILYIFLSMMFIYYSKGVLYPSGTFISFTALIIIYFISVYYMVVTIKNRSINVIDNWVPFIFLIIIVFIISGNFSNAIHRITFISVLTAILPIFPIYCLAKKGIVKENTIIKYLTLIFIITVIKYYYNKNNLLETTPSEDLINNISYSFVLLLPFVFLIYNRKIFSNVLITIILIFTLLSLKRGAVIAAMIGILIYIMYQYKMISRSNKIQDYVIMPIILGLVLFVIYYFYTNNQNLLYRMSLIQTQEGSIEHRNYIYRSIYHAWLSTDSLIDKIFGFGFASSVQLSGGSLAHNDWLEILSSFGLVGIVIYVRIVYNNIKYMRKTNWILPNHRMLFIALCAIWFFITLISMWFNSIDTHIATVLLGYVVGNNEQLKIEGNLLR